MNSVDGPLVDNNDIFYLVIPTLEKIRLGMVYHMKASDHLLNVAKQFGVSFYNLLELNPDLLRSDQYENLEGKRICILPSTSKFDKCMAPQATPNPYFYEADFPTPPYFYYGNQGRGVPIKQYNPLYPEAPIPVPPP
ncbi:hypothetical protein GUITHDRAFT_99001 [Guillardia theta CCMP2712]|uniref:LysM domain-containing protein n=1 Tax=Guillardia theta (strain CCMP2712) TaxID=905079 RepID=L1K3S1_GUITC|nr:hypothetical protein GUITHDRAFT_99001 [Guillardia theta CCMP2712]EKX55222.1 hypothetical protein GUITHDRAFT_99001 [Guillardia theta CCMP2712]|mmetsp:Transcript_36698/g.114590  ORF Transcript_36698/g.114590 Transcript_36698/m.114590 type:complete len:137 (-) Transcript_36698:1834-2244(-)|eukprot:XP_005842202.1 hypothetical protein GUITHDRAFT_99001 [Guillardia theta CCMP2712]